MNSASDDLSGYQNWKGKVTFWKGNVILGTQNVIFGTHNVIFGTQNVILGTQNVIFEWDCVQVSSETCDESVGKDTLIEIIELLV